MFPSVSLVLAGTALAAAQSGSLEGNEVLVAQILLDRAHHSPGVIDGKQGGNTSRAITAFERGAGLHADGKLDPEVIRRLQSSSQEPLFLDYQIQSEDVEGLVEVPASMVEQAKLDKLGYETVVEALAERFHMGQDLLKRLNPDAGFKAGETIRVVSPGKDELGAKIARIEVDKALSQVRALTAEGKMIASYPATIGSNAFPSPSGTMEVRAVALEPKYYFDPENREWGPDKKLTIAAGPNNPVGSTWIDLTKEGYGIHGTPEPRLIGKTASHGCVRLTNWDAAELGNAVEQGATVTFL